MQDGGKTGGGHTPTASISSINSFTLLDTQRQDYFEMSKKGLIKNKTTGFVLLFSLVFDNLNNLYKRLSVLALEQQQMVKQIYKIKRKIYAIDF